jgi:hypothetical protein
VFLHIFAPSKYVALPSAGRHQLLRAQQIPESRRARSSLLENNAWETPPRLQARLIASLPWSAPLRHRSKMHPMLTPCFQSDRWSATGRAHNGHGLTVARFPHAAQTQWA